MGKRNFNPRNNYLTTNGILDRVDVRVDQYVLVKSDVTFNKLETTTDVICNRDLIVHGNATILGSTTVIDTDIVTMKDNVIVINSDETGSGVTLNLSGVEIERGTLTNYQAVFEESSDLYKIGPTGSLQAVATREDSPLSKGVMVYNASLGRIDSSTTIELPINLTANEQSIASSSGTLRITGGAGITGDIFLDNSIHFLGSDYSNNIKSDNTNNLVVTSGSDISFVQTSGKKFKISNGVPIQLGTSGDQYLSNTGGNLVELVNSTGDINLTTQTSGKVVVPEQTKLNWGTNSNYITFDGSNTVLNSTGDIQLSSGATTVITSTNSSTSPTIGAFVSNGGISISKTQDSASSDNGGSFTTAGGAAIKQQLKVGGSIDIGDTATTVLKGAGLGLNLRSLAKTITSNSFTGVDATFNSFEGGTISTANAAGEVSTVFISGPPTVSGGGSIANPYSLVVNSGNTKLQGTLELNSTQASTSPTVGAFKLNGGISINKNTNAVSSSNGGSLTTSGGVGVVQDLIVGGTAIVGDLGASLVQTPGNGITFRSLNKALTTSSSNNTAFNSFEGGSIVSSSTIPISSTVFISGSPTISGGGSINSAYSLLVNSGNSLFNGKISISNTALDSLALLGGISITNTNFPSLVGDSSSFTTLGGASISKNLLVGTYLKTNNGTGVSVVPHLLLANGDLSRFSFGLKGAESSGNAGSNLELNTYDDSGASLGSVFNVTRSNLNVTFNSTTNSTSVSSGALVLSGGISINSSTDATDITNGGTFTTGGGASITKKLFVGGASNFANSVTVVGTSNLNKTVVNTNNGTFDISGSNGIVANVSGNTNITTASGTLTLSATSGTTTLSGSTGVTVSSASNIGITSGGTTTITNASGNFNTTSVASTTTTTGGNIQLTSSNGISLSANGSTSSGLSLQASDTTLGVRIGTSVSGIPVSIGTNNSQTNVNGDLTIAGSLTIMGTTTTIDSTIVTVNDNSIVVNSAPSGISDGGLLVRRYQNPNNSGLGEVVTDIPKFTGTFGTGSNTPITLALSASGSAVDAYYRGWWIKITSGPAAGVVRRIKDYYGATKMATIYSTSDNSIDGLDLIAVPNSGDSYSLFDSPYIGFYYSESTGEVMISGVSADIGTGEFRNPTSFYPIHVKSVVAEEGITISGDLNVDGRAIIRKDDTNTLVVTTTSDKPILNVDTVSYTTTLGSPVNTVNSGHIINFTGLNSVNTDTIYSRIRSVINNNVGGTLESKLSFFASAGVSGLQELFTVSGYSGGTSTFNSLVNVTNTVSSSSTTTASVVLSGGLSINNTSEATNENNGGTFTTGGGAGIKKKLFVGGNTNLVSTSAIANNSNTIAIDTATLNVAGDLTLYNAAKQTIYFGASGSGAPTFTTRSSGSKLVLKPSTTASTVDTSLGVSSGGNLWSSVPDTTGSQSIYLGTTEYFKVSNTGITLPVYDTSLTLAGSAKIKGITGDAVYLSPQNDTASKGFVFTNSAATSERVKVNGLGQIQANISNSDANTSGQGSVFEISGNTLTDSVTSVSGTVPLVSISKTSQSTLSSTNTSVTSTVTASNYIEGAVIKGINENFGNTSALYIDSVNSINTSGDTIPLATSLYIKNAPTGNNIVRARSILVESGISEFGDKSLYSLDTSISNTSNTVDNTTGAISILGDISLYNETKQTIYFSGAGNGAPSYSTRTDGAKLVLSPSISSTTVDTAIGTNSSGDLWLSSPDSSGSQSFYLGELRKMQLNGTGLSLDSGASNSVFTIYTNTSDSSDNKGITICGGGSSGVSRGASLELYGNEYTSGNAVISSGEYGKISLKTGSSGIERIAVASTGESLFTSTTDSSSSGSSSSIKTLGGVSVAKNVSIGTGLNLDFNQAYFYSGESSGSLLIQSQVTTVDSVVKYFTKDGDNSTSNNLIIYGLGTPSSQTNSEFLKLGYTSGTGYIIKTDKTGTGVANSITLQTGGNASQLVVNTDSTISINSNTASTSNSSGALKISGGLGISNTTDATSSTNGGTITTAGGLAVAKKVFIGSDTSIGTNLTVSGTTATTSNTTGAVLLSGGLGISNTTDATSSTNGGTITTAGGLAVAKKVFIGSDTSISTNLTVSGTTATTSNTTGSVLLSGGLGISNTTDATSSTNGGTITTAGGLAVAKKAYIGSNLDVGGNLTVTGTVTFGITAPTLSISNDTNTASTPTCTKSVLTKNGNSRTLSAVFRLTPSTQGLDTTFDVVLPDLATNLVNVYDIIVNTTGYNIDSAPVSIENLFGYGITGGTSMRIKFTAASTLSHTIQVIVNYSV